ncbi:histidine kinase [Streptomyces sp. NBC_00658]|uniref:histidine kinase n=1 Tax=Streptomyces sp. NBC_00658 TaxID=2975800 RepID=UPI00324ABA2A
MDWKLPLNPAGGRLIKISSLIAFTLTWFADFALLGRGPDPFGSPTTWLPVIVTGPLIGLLALGVPRSADLAKRVIGAVTISLAVTVWSLIEPPTLHWWGALETCGLLFLTVHTTAHAWRPGRATAYTLALVAAILALPLRSGSWGAFLAGGYVLTIALAICIVIGCAIRALEVRRERAVHDVRQAERLALARDLHDLIAHHMTGIIVQANAALTIQATAPDKVDPILRTIARSGTEPWSRCAASYTSCGRTSTPPCAPATCSPNWPISSPPTPPPAATHLPGSKSRQPPAPPSSAPKSSSRCSGWSRKPSPTSAAMPPAPAPPSTWTRTVRGCM